MDNLGILVPFMIGELVGEITVRPKYNTSMLHYGLNKLFERLCSIRNVAVFVFFPTFLRIEERLSLGKS